jgi:hypothetical protein
MIDMTDRQAEMIDRQTDRHTDRHDKQNGSFAPTTFRMHLQHMAVHIIDVL